MNLVKGGLAGGLLVAAVALSVSACHFPGMSDSKAPTGQVVAKVGDREITLRELQSEMGNATFADPKARKEAEQNAVQNIVARVILADAAVQEGVDKTPDFNIQKLRLVDNLLVQNWQQKLAAAVPTPTRGEAQDFVNTHPDTFSERKVFAVDQIRMPRPSDPSVLKALEPLKTMEQVEGYLKSAKIPYQRSSGSVDAVGSDPRLVDAILKLPPNEVFVVPGGAGLLVNQVVDTKIMPFTGEPAIDYATQFLSRQRSQETIQKAIGQALAEAGGRVLFNKDYQPPKPAPTPPAAGAPAAAK